MDRKSRVGFSMLAVMVLFFYASFVTAEPAKEIEVNTVVITDRYHSRMQPEIYHAFMTESKKAKPALKMNFVVFNPFKYRFIGESEETQKALMDLLKGCVNEVVSIKKGHPQTAELLSHIHVYIQKHPGSHLARVHKRIEDFMSRYHFLIIESSDTFGVHPMFYTPGVTRINTPEGATEKDIIEALYGLFFVDAALKQEKLIWGTCHGSQIGYVHAGGRLGRLFVYKKAGYDAEFKKTRPGSAEDEIWRLEEALYTQKYFYDYPTYELKKYPVPEILKREDREGKEMYLNKDFEHSLGLVQPIPKGIEVISYHPLSEYGKKACEETYRDDNEAFSKILINQVLVDAYKYKTMLGTQYHPQYTYNDLETSIVFDYLVRQLIAQMTDKKKTERK